jgi:hypothetical protein
MNIEQKMHGMKIKIRENQTFLQVTKWLIFQCLYMNLHLNYGRQKYMKHMIHEQQTTKNCK